MVKKVMIGCPVRNRAWILPVYLHHLLQLDYPLKNLVFCFILNDCIDDTRQVLEEFADRRSNRVILIENNIINPGRHQRGFYSFSRLAQLRNLLLTQFLASDCQSLFSLDSDILAPPQSLSMLMKNERRLVSALVCNGHEVDDKGIYNLLYRDPEGNYRHLRDFPRDRLFAVDCTGAAILIAREVIEQYGVRYGSKEGGEDIDFCENAHRQGIGIFCDGRVECTHIMQEEEADYTKKEKIWRDNHIVCTPVIV